MEQKSNQQGEGVTLSLGRGLVVGGVNKKFQWGGAAVWGPLGFFVFLLIFKNSPPPFECEFKTSIYRQNVARFFNLVPQLPSFCKF